MEFRILGPVEVVETGRRLPLGGVKQRALLAILLLNANRRVSRDRLIDGIWGERPPGNPHQALDSYVSRLRKLLGHERISRHGASYQLRVGQGELDLDRFEEAVAAGRYAEALAVWRGPALADLRFEPFAEGEAERLDERRRQIVEERVEADLARGEGPALVAELETLVAEEPRRERLVGQLMVALYRSGRQAAALEVYRRTRHGLAEELGLDPAPQLRELERRILAHDATLLGKSALGAPPRTRRRPARRARLGALLLLAAGAAAAAVVFTRGGTDHRSPSAQSSRVVAVGSAHGRAFALPAAPVAIASSAGSLWLADTVDQAVLRADPDSGGVVDRIPIPGQPGSLAVGAGAVWVAGTIDGTIDRIDPTTETVTERLSLGQADTSAIAYAHGALWAADTTDDAIVELDPASGSPERTFSLDSRPTSLVVGDKMIWVADHDGASVSEVDLASGQTVATIPVGDGPSSLVLGAGGLWVANSLDSTVTRIDPTTSDVVATIPVGSSPTALAVADGVVWVANEYSGTISRIDPRRNAVTATVDIGGQPLALATNGKTVWVGAGPHTALHRGGTLVLASSSKPLSIDPAVYSSAPATTFTSLVWDSLVRFASVSGPDGLRLVPDLALNVPTPSASGLIYRFRLRPGIRYSDGRLVRASDFRRGLERLFHIDSPGRDDFADLVGAAKCRRRSSTCDLSRGVIIDDRAGTIEFHLARGDADFLFKLTDYAFSAPIPPGVPNRDEIFKPVPGTGPYRIVSANQKEIRFERNPYFREWSHAAQPAGNPDTILWRFSASHAQTVHWVQQGTADWSMDLLSHGELHTLRARSPAQLHINPLFAVDFLPLNTHLAPFNDVRVRRALNYAIDRRKISQMYNGPSIAAPTCQPLVPGLLGYHRYCPYTTNPDATGAYHGPDLAKAKELVTASGTRGERVTVWGITEQFVIPPQLTTYIAHVLRRLGYRVNVHVEPGERIDEKSRRTFQLSTDGDWLPTYPTPSSYLVPFFTCGGALSNGYTCNPKLDAQMQNALSLQLTNPAEAAALWRRIDDEITDDAYWVPTVAPRIVEFVSKRVRNYEFQPAFASFLADQVWLNRQAS
jgi:YVTN family beta-propeller protein